MSGSLRTVRIRPGQFARAYPASGDGDRPDRMDAVQPFIDPRSQLPDAHSRCVPRPVHGRRSAGGDPVRQPITFIYQNVVFRDAPDDVWAVYKLPMRSYARLPVAGKRELLSRLAALARGLEADFSLLRVSRPWDVDHYALGVLTGSDIRHVRRAPLERHLARQRRELGGRASHVPEAYLSVRLHGARALTPRTLASLPAVRAVRRALALHDRRIVSRHQLERVLAEEEAVRHLVRDHFQAAAAATHELQWLIRRAFTRGLGDPFVDERFLPQAIEIDPPAGGGETGYRPLEVDLLRLFDSPINVEARKLRIETERGDSHQAFLCLGSLPEAAQFPGPQAELLFAPLESLRFPVDAAFNARLARTGESARIVRRGIVTAESVDRAHAPADHGSEAADDRLTDVRELAQRLSGTERPLLLRATVSLAVGAPSADELEERIELLRREYDHVALHRPLGEQLGLFIAHLPAQRVPVSDYDDYLTAEQFGAMVPLATHAVGTDTGPCVGFALTGLGQPVLFDLTKTSRAGRPRATLLAGTVGSGRTSCLELIIYQAFLTGSVICDVDPKGEHALDRLPGVADELEVIELSADERYRGVLDPLRIAPAETREDAACSFLLSMLPARDGPAFEHEIRLAIRKVITSGDCCCAEVIEELSHGCADARVAARALSIRSASSIAKLGFAEPGAKVVDAGSPHLASVRIPSLPVTPPSLGGGEPADDPRLTHAILRLLPLYGLHLTSADRSRHAVLSVDEAWALLCDPPGRVLLDCISRVGEARNVTPLLATRTLGSVDEFEALIGPAFCFGVDTEQEARAALRLMRIDESDGARRQLLSFRRGRCLMRDHEGRVSPIQVDAGDGELLAMLGAGSARAEQGAGSGRAEQAAEHQSPDGQASATVYELEHLRR